MPAGTGRPSASQIATSLAVGLPAEPGLLAAKGGSPPIGAASVDPYISTSFAPILLRMALATDTGNAAPVLRVRRGRQSPRARGSASSARTNSPCTAGAPTYQVAEARSAHSTNSDNLKRPRLTHALPVNNTV